MSKPVTHNEQPCRHCGCCTWYEVPGTGMAPQWECEACGAVIDSDGDEVRGPLQVATRAQPQPASDDKRTTEAGGVTVREQREWQIDELVATNASVHLEMLDVDAACLIINDRVFNIAADGDRLSVTDSGR